MNYVVRHGLFVGLDDGFPSSRSMSVIAGNLSATILHAEFQSRCSQGNWKLAIPDSVSRLNRANLVRLLRQFLVETPSTEPALIYFAGHGCSFQGRYIFCPQDFDIDIPDAMGLTLDLLNSLIERFNPADRRLLLFFDTCRTLLDKTAMAGDRMPPNCSLLYTCNYADDVIEIDGYSDFVRGFILRMSEAAASEHDGLIRLSIADAIDDLTRTRVKAGSGRPLYINVSGQALGDSYLLIQTEPKKFKPLSIQCRLDSRPRPPGFCGRIQGEILNRVSHTMGVPMNPDVVQRIESDTKDTEFLRITVPLARAAKNAGMLDYVINQWSSLFTELCIAFPSAAVANAISRILRSHDFEILLIGGKSVAIKKMKIGFVAAKVEFTVAGNQCDVCLSCVGEDEKWGLERLGDLFVPLVRDIIDAGDTK